MRVWVGWVFVAIAVVTVSVQAYMLNQDRETVECHTRAMDKLHLGLYNRLAEDPGKPQVWGFEWLEDFKVWEQEMKDCMEHH